MRPPQPRFALILSSLAIAACLASAELAAHSSPARPDPASEQTARQAASSRTQDLLTLHQRWQQAAPQDKQQRRELMLAQAEQRRQLLAELVKTHPAEVLRVAIPANKRAGLPAELLPLLEEQVEIEGELEVVHVDDFENPSQSRIEYALKTAFGERFALHEATKSAKELQSGQQVRLNGLLVPPAAAAERADDGDIVVNSFDEDILSLAAGNSASYGSQPGVQANTVGEQRTLVMMVNFQDAPSNKPWTSSAMQALFTDQINPFYQEVSYNQTSFKATVFGWQTISTSSTSCDRSAITNLADQAATAAGHVLGNYDRLVYAFPSSSNCGWGGLGTVGGKPSRAWLNGSFNRHAYTHELGHNLGLFHSHDLECGSSTLGSNCSVTEYGDLADTMGGGMGHFNAYQKDRLGWFGNRILSIGSSGSYRLSPYEFTGTQPLALKALRSIDSSSGAKTWYYLEYRQASGYDSSLGNYSTSNLHKGVSINSGVDLNGNTSYKLDMTPETTSWRDAALESGKRFTDSGAGISIATQWADGKEALVDVSLGTEQCTQRNPSVSLTASSDNWVTAGTAVRYSLTVSNKDSSSCSSRSFSLSAGVPSGWSKSLSQSALSLAPGASATATLSVTSASGAAAGVYDITASAVSGSSSATATAAYVVEATASNSAPVAKNDSGSTNANTAVTIAVLANDSDPDGDSLSVSTISGVSNGTAKLNSNGSISFTPASGYSGTTSFGYSISDGRGGSANAQVSVSVAASTLQAPVANADQVSLSSISPVVIPVLANDSDPQGAKLTVVGVTQGSKGTVTINADGTLSYSPARSLKSSDSFSYTISNGSKTASASVTVTLQQSSGSTGGKGNGNGNGNGNGKKA
jgi:hypothetical protein